MEVVERFFYASEGLEAAELLAANALLRKRPKTAALLYERILDRPEDRALEPSTLFRAAQAFRETSDRVNLARAWKRLEAAAVQGEVEIDRKTVSLAELRKEVYGPEGARAARDWRLFRGAAARSTAAIGGPPFLEPLWSHSLYSEHAGKAIGSLLKEAQDHLATRKQPILPASHPIAML